MSLKNLDIKFQRKRMPASVACAMWDDSNTDLKPQRVILRYLRNWFGRSLVVSDKLLKEFGEDHVPPVCSSFIDITNKSKKIHYWTKSICTVTEQGLQKCFMNSQFEELHKIDIVTGGDYGQGKFRQLVRCLCRDRQGKVIKEFKLKICHIDCTKDTYHVLKNTIGGNLNQDLKK